MSMSVSLAAGAVAVLCASRVAAQSPSPAPMMMNGTMAPPPEPSTEDLAALMPPYVATADVEYTPLRAPPSGPAVMDVGMGMTVATATECAQACIDSTEECNAATWLGNDPTWELEENCYLKVIAQPCDVPEEAEEFPGAYLLMAQTPGCEMVAGIPPNMPTEDASGAPSGAVSAAGTLGPDGAPAMAPGPGMAPSAAAGSRDIGVTADGSAVPAGTPGSVPADSPGAPPVAAPGPGSDSTTGAAETGAGDAATGGALSLAGGAAVALASLVALLA